MRQKTIMPLGIVLLILLIGCSSHQVDVAWQEARPLGRDLTTSLPPIQPPEAEEPTSLQEPTGVINQRQALALALMHNPYLKAFSWAVPCGRSQNAPSRTSSEPGVRN